MDEAFRLNMTGEEKQYCLDLVRWSISSRFARMDKGEQPAGDDLDGVPEPPTDLMRQQLGAFVTLKLSGNLRGCIGNVIGERPLYRTIVAMAQSAAFEDPRFPQLTPTEFAALDIEISILGPLTQCPDPALVQVGRHGLLINHQGRSGLLLPQVAVEWGWDRETFLHHTCQKAGLPPDAWKQPAANLFWFEAEVF